MACHLVIHAVVVKKPIVAAPNALIVVRVNQVLDKTVPAKNVRLVKHGHPAMRRLILVRLVVQDFIKKNLGKLLVCSVYPENINRKKDKNHALSVKKDHSVVHQHNAHANLV